MKKNLVKVFAFIIIMLLILLYIFLKYIILLPNLYVSNNSLDKETNKEIKTLLLNVIKDYHSTIYSMDKDNLYTEEYRFEYMQYDNSPTAKSMFININSNFMEYVNKTNAGEYTAELQMRFPDDWHYYFDIKVIDGQFFISYLEIDP